MSETVIVALLGLAGVVVASVLTYLGTIRKARREAEAAPQTAYLDEARAKELIQDAYAGMVADLRAENRQLRADVEALRTELRQVRVQAFQEQQQLRVQVADLTAKNEALLNQVADLQSLTEKQAKEIARLEAWRSIKDAGQ